MEWDKRKRIPENEIREKITRASVEFAEEFGEYLATGDKQTSEALTASQLRKFFGEVKRQQMNGYEHSKFIMLKPKLAYAVGRARSKSKVKNKIEDFYDVMADAIDKVVKSPAPDKAFRNFIDIFEAIVAYHKAAENKKP
ncbi:MAG: type III-A CRISPR-associated protein Csm2 [Prevotella sp.]|uniref:type III-A CRISPR-associated protein Csm2 n=1 Tax=Prevotella sp. TaxID=59823 RepID=UPI002A26ECF7|nr:type III-A CRISPR-associated protein Csm2 [Prevotella sp.]MDD7318983.1 type III-A CRISPR-associated protein Csm2 [Prevotellaceae bacterium]MDY4020009.1 type III-A CRISPR-associated protein Csm2 [Prevotella sp.]